MEENVNKTKPELPLLQKYDAVLDALYNTSGDSPTFDKIMLKLNEMGRKVDDGEVWDILNTMIKDGYLYFVHHNEKNIDVYLLSFNGKYLKETGGLEKKIEREKTKEELNNKLNDSNLKNGKWTRNNIILTSITGGITLIALLVNLGITLNRESKELQRHLKDSIQQVKSQENASELNEEIRQIRQHLQDTSKKIKIVK